MAVCVLCVCVADPECGWQDVMDTVCVCVCVCVCICVCVAVCVLCVCVLCVYVADPMCGWQDVMDTLCELYWHLKEEDMWAGLFTKRSRFPETNTAIAYEQHGFYEQAQTQYELVSGSIISLDSKMASFSLFFLLLLLLLFCFVFKRRLTSIHCCFCFDFFCKKKK